MKWSERHDIFFCREILLMKPYKFKPGSTERGNAWTSIAVDLGALEDITFNVTQKSVRDRYRLLVEKHKRKMRSQEGESGSTTEETELDQLLQNITEEADEATGLYDQENKRKQEENQKDRRNAEEVRMKALEGLGETQKRRNEEEKDDPSSLGSRKKRKSGTETMVYLQNKAEKEFELRKEELQMKKQEMEQQKELLKDEKQNQLLIAQNTQKMFEQFQSQQVNLQQQLIQQQHQYQQMYMSQQQQQQQQTQMLLTLIEKLTKN